MGSTLFVADLHIGHSRICEIAGRPFSSVEEMNATLIENINAVVRPQDTLYILGDVVMGNFMEGVGLLDKINGFKHLIAGNHDKVFKGNKQAYIDRFMPIYRRYFNSIADTDVMMFAENAVMLSHFPYTGDSHGEDRYAKYRPVDRGIPIIHGHTHGKEVVTYTPAGTMQIHVGVDAWAYQPVHFDQIVEILRNEKV